MPNKSISSQAADRLREFVELRVGHACEKVLEEFPGLALDKENILELLYLEHLFREEVSGTEISSSPSREYSIRFPELEDDINKLFEVATVIGQDTVDSHSNFDRTFTASDSDSNSLPLESPLGNLKDYVLLEEIGRGGTGVVYRAKQNGLERIVAIKTPSSWAGVDRYLLEQFRREAELASSLHHPNIVPIYEVGAVDGLPFYSMEYIEGGSLAEVLERSRLSTKTAAKLVCIIARAVDYAHAQGVLHRDLKPGNILLSLSQRPDAVELPSRDVTGSVTNGSSYEPRIVDFGLAVELNQSKLQTVRRAGTPSYMAPEQIDPKLGELGPRTDVYALGCVLYHALTGQPPFHASNSEATMEQVLSDSPVSPKVLNGTVPRDLESICLKCLQKSPSDRYESAELVAKDLSRYLEAKAVSSRRISVIQHAGKWTFRHPSLAALFFLLLLASGLTTWLWLRSESSLEAERAERKVREQLSYDREVSLAFHAYNSHDTGRANELLHLTDTSLRKWEWDFLDGLCNQSFWTSPTQVSQSISAASLSPDGKMAVIGHGTWGEDHDQTIRVWDIEANELRLELKGHPKSSISNASFSPDGLSILTSAVTWQTKQTFGKVLEWDAQTGKLKREIANVNAYATAYCRSGTAILVGDTSGTIRMHQASDGSVVQEFARHRGMVLSISVSSDGKIFASCARDGTLSIWDIATGTELYTLANLGDTRRVVWNPEVNRLVVCLYGGRASSYTWDGKKLTLGTEFAGNGTQKIVYSPDGSYYACSLFGEGTKFMDARNGRVISVFPGHQAATSVLGFDRLGYRFITGGADGVCHVWDLTRPSTSERKDYLSHGPVTAMVYHPTRDELAIATGKDIAQIHLWNSEDAKLNRSIKGQNGSVTSLAFSPDGKQIISGSEDRIARIFDSSSGKVKASLRGHSAKIVLVGFMDQASVFSLDESGEIRTWNLATKSQSNQWKPFLEPQDSSDRPTNSLCASWNASSGRLAIAHGKSLWIWKVETGGLLLSQKLENDATCIQFDWTGNRLAISNESATANGSTGVGIWEVQLGNARSPASIVQTLNLSGHPKGVTSIAFNPEGTRLVTASKDENIRLFGLDLGSELMKLHHGLGEQKNVFVAFNSRGTQLARSEASQLWLFNSNPKEMIQQNDFEFSRRLHHQKNYQAARNTSSYYAALFHARHLVEMEPSNAPVRLKWIELLLVTGDLRNAVDQLLAMPEDGENDLERMITLAHAYLLLNQKDQYSQSCSKAFAMLKEDTPRKKVAQVGCLLTLSDASGIEPKAVVDLLTKTLRGRLTSFENFSLGLAHYRASELDKATKIVKQVNGNSERGLGVLLQYMVRSKLRHHKKITDAADNPSPFKNMIGSVNSLYGEGESLDDACRLTEWLRIQNENVSLGRRIPFDEDRFRVLYFSILAQELRTGKDFEHTGNATLKQLYESELKKYEYSNGHERVKTSMSSNR